MSLRFPHAVAVGNAGHECRLAHVLSVGQQHQKAKTTQVKVTSASIDQRIEDAISRAGHSSHTVSMLGPPPPKLPAVAANIDGLADQLSRLNAEEDTDATGKRKVDGSLAATRLGQTTSERWANERFRQTMLLILEFRREWPTQSLLRADDVDSIRTAVDNALFMATSRNHVGDIYDMNPTVWAIWLVQNQTWCQPELDRG